MKIKFHTLALLLMPLILFACGPGSGKEKKEEKASLEEAIVKNKVRPEGKAIQITKEFKINPEDEVGTIQSEAHFDENGNQVKLIQYDFYGSGAVDSETNYSYDDKGNKVEMNDGTTKTVYAYNDKNQMVGETWSRANGQGASEEITYDEQGERVESKYFDAAGKYDFSRVREISYDEEGNITEEKKWEKYTDGSADLMQYWIKYTYGTNGKMESKIDMRESGQESSREVYEYDGAGNKTAALNFEGEGEFPVDKEVFQFNEYGEVVKDQTFNCNDQGDCNSLQYTNEYKYDESGRNTWQMYVHADGEAWGSRFEFTYYE